MKTFNQLPRNNAGFMTAEFLFAFTMVIGAGCLIFALTFALTTVEVAQYIVWSSARAHAAGNKTVTDSENRGRDKYTNLTAAFPLLTGEGSDSPWFKMAKVTDAQDFTIGDLSLSMKRKDGAIDPDNASSPGGEARHPWIGVESSIDLILFKNSQIPFLGKAAEDPNEFTFPVRGILFRHPSQDECVKFFQEKFRLGIKEIKVENGGDTNIQQQVKKWRELSNTADVSYSPMEDNGC